MLTLVDLCEKLKKYDEITLMERLEINSEDLVARFIDIIEDNFDELCEEVEEVMEEDE